MNIKKKINYGYRIKLIFQFVSAQYKQDQNKYKNSYLNFLSVIAAQIM